MSADEEIALAKRLPKGARRALLAMTETPTLPGKATFNANGAFNLTWCARSHGGLATFVVKNGRPAYFLTSFGRRIQARILASVDTHPKDGDVQQAPLVSGAVGGSRDAQ